MYEEDQGMIDFPQGFADDGGPRKVKVEEGPQRAGKRKLRPADTDIKGNSSWVIKFAILMVVVLIAAYYLVAEHEKSQLEHAREDFVNEQVEPLSKKWEFKYAKLEGENEKLATHEREYLQLKEEHDVLLARESKREERIESLNEKVEYYKGYQVNIQQRIQLMSHALVLEK